MKRRAPKPTERTAPEGFGSLPRAEDSIFLSARSTGILVLAFAAASLVAAVLAAAPGGVSSASEAAYLVFAVATVVGAALLLLYLRGRVAGISGMLSGAALRDPLTGLPNRQAFREALVENLDSARATRGALSLLICDVDRLRELNKAVRHDGADRLLKSVGALLAQETREGDTVARVGPGSFAIVLAGAGEEEAFATAERLLKAVRRGFRGAGDPGVTVSIGIASFPKRAADAEQLLDAADRALFTAKVLGRDRAIVSSPEIEQLMQPEPHRRPDESLSHLKTLLSLAEALDMRDPRTTHHAETVGWYAERIARELGMSEPRVARVRLAGLLHDIGKVGVPDVVMFKNGPLDEREWQQMRRHPEIGARILGSSEFADIREWVYCCQERPDGKGYPRALRGEEIPLESRILGVADAYEAMTCDREYRTALGTERAADELRRGAGSEFDPEVVEALLAVVERHGTRSHLEDEKGHVAPEAQARSEARAPSEPSRAAGRRE